MQQTTPLFSFPWAHSQLLALSRFISAGLCSQYLILPPYILPAISWKQCKTTRSSHCWQLFYRASTVGNFIILVKKSWLFKYFIVEFFMVFLLSLLCISHYNTRSLCKYKSHILYLFVCPLRYHITICKVYISLITIFVDITIVA